MAQRAFASNTRTIPYPRSVAVRPNVNPFEEKNSFFKFTNSISSAKRTIVKFFAVTIFSIIGLNLFINAKSAELSFQLSNYEQKTNSAYQKIDSINQKINQKTAPNNLLKLAAAHSMVPAKDSIYINVESRKIYKSTIKKAKVIKKSSKKQAG